MANSWGADYLISVHINAGGGTGFESYIYNGSVSNKTKQAQDIVHSEITKLIPDVRDRGKKRANLHMCRESKMPAILTECLFIDNPQDANKLKDKKFLDLIAKGHANGIVKAFGLKKKQKKEDIKPVQNKQPSNNQKERADKEMLEAAVVINSFADFPMAEAISKKYKAPIYLRDIVQGEIAKTVYIVGGLKEGIKADKIVDLSGANRYETAQKVGQYLKAL